MKRVKKALYPVVLVEWVDSSTSIKSVWRPIAEIPKDAARVQSAGFLVRDLPDSVLIASSADQHHAAGAMHIPKCAILAMTTLRKADK